MVKITTTLIKGLEPKNTGYDVRDTEIKGFLLKVHPSGKMTYYLDYRTSDGLRKSYRIGGHGTLKLAQAREIAGLRAADVAHGTDIQTAKKEIRQQAELRKVNTLGGFLEHKYGPWVENERKSGTQTLKRIAAQFRFLFPTPLSNITPWIIEKWRSEQRKAGKASTTVNRDVMALKSALSKAVQWDVLDVHPLTKVKPIKTDDHGHVRYLSKSEAERLRKVLDERELRLREERLRGNVWRRERGYEEYPDLFNVTYADHIKPMVLLTLNTGMRRGELFNIQWEDVNFHTNKLTVKGETAKSGKTRYIPLSKEARAVVKAWREQQKEHSGLVFPGKNGAPFNNVKSAWTAVREAAHLNDFRWHDMRHDFASKLVMAGVSLYAVKELLGHASIVVTERYSHLAPEHLEDAVAKLA